MKSSEKLTNIIEGILLVSGNAVAVSDIADKLLVTESEIIKAVNFLKSTKYTKDSGIQLLVFNKKLQFASNSAYVEDITAVLNPIKERELSRALLEVVAIIAYRQPITRVEIDTIRGLDSEYSIAKLQELGLIEAVGRKDAVGRPILFGTTDEFLKRFKISSLEELPDYDELLEKITKINDSLFNADSYLYSKEEYNGDAESAATEDNKLDNMLPPDKEEIPDFLKDEDVSFISADDKIDE